MQAKLKAFEKRKRGMLRSGKKKERVTAENLASRRAWVPCKVVNTESTRDSSANLAKSNQKIRQPAPIGRDKEFLIDRLSNC